jgi:hypothetical protein
MGKHAAKDTEFSTMEQATGEIRGAVDAAKHRPRHLNPEPPAKPVGNGYDDFRGR